MEEVGEKGEGWGYGACRYLVLGRHNDNFLLAYNRSPPQIHSPSPNLIRSNRTYIVPPIFTSQPFIFYWSLLEFMHEKNQGGKDGEKLPPSVSVRVRGRNCGSSSLRSFNALHLKLSTFNLHPIHHPNSGVQDESITSRASASRITFDVL